jgi:hypothetical protein
MNTTLEYSTRVVQEGDRRCKKSTLNDLAYLTPLRIPLMNPVCVTELIRRVRVAHERVALPKPTSYRTTVCKKLSGLSSAHQVFNAIFCSSADQDSLNPDSIFFA